MKRTVLAVGTATALIFGGMGVALADGESIYTNGTSPTCSSCHERGVAGAPKLNAPEDWEDRPSSVDELVDSTLSGKGAMPAYESRADRGDLVKAIEYMLSTL
ncbi:c-type cytochrome [Halorhodospira halophila]|uniref:Cytochrome c domain-containing protein n=1 Tax=Halorhodospira halophila (strain DSM 244 / SL1) TaxID=349124 RepID=A1WTA0_HALHL|nr:cytochrome c [Halorhodospira halophila]ABM60912.1 hypothetical protein Hhal_0118 [Halorhodospira halophila SL1]MBK1728570.1 hypothetical protein [Halorhodospira halophila]